MSATEVLQQIRKLPIEERREVFERLRDEFDDELTPAQIAELERRGEQLRRNPESGIPWEKVRAELKDRIKGR